MIRERTARPLILPRPGAPRLGDAPRTLAKGALYLGGSLVLLGAIWMLAALLAGKDLPGPFATLRVFWDLVSNPFYDAGPSDKGIGLQLLASLQRVFTGFLIGSAVSIPLGLLLGLNPFARRFVDPLVQILRPVSPLAWFPIGLAAFHSAPSATVFMIFITSLWPTVINTAFGVGTLPESHKNVARVFQFSRRKYLFRVVLPYSLP